ncbi:MAG: hypothetical protein V1779_09280 [bacterium]
MIECNKDYIKIIKERCNVDSDVEVIKYDFIPYFNNYKMHEVIDYKLFEPKIAYESSNQKSGFIKVYNSKKDYYDIIDQFRNQTMKFNYGSKSTFFIGCKEFDNDLIYRTSQLNLRGWIIRNMIVIEENNSWFPLFMIVDDNKKTKYNFNYKALNLKSKNEYQRNWNDTNFIGMKIIDSVSKNRKNGKVIDILEKLESGFPKYILAKWDDNVITKEFVVFSQEKINNNLKIKSGKMGFQIKEIKNYTTIDKTIDDFKKINEVESTESKSLQKNNNYNGKFKNEKRINFGASPGARSSVDEEYFSLQRLYEVDQNLIVDYLNHKRIKKGLTKQGLTNCFPPDYKHTVGHWLRKDFGGSLPALEDWDNLVKILDIEESITNYICKTALRFQTVKHAEFKMPSDFQQSEFLKNLELLIK